MMSPDPAPNLESQWLTPAKVAWVLDLSERTLREWNSRRVIPFYKFGEQVVRYDPKDVLAFLLRRRRAAAGERHDLVALPRMEADPDWESFRRLIRLEFENLIRERKEPAEVAA